MIIKKKLLNPKLLLDAIIRNVNINITRFYIKILKMNFRFPNTKDRNELIIVSMTSWKKRINNVEFVVNTILNNTLVPDKIICNLSIDEFPLQEIDLPEGLLKLSETGIFEINWLKGNTKAFKKFIPILKKYPDDIIITIDDDFLYPKDFIETFYRRHLEKPNIPLSGNNVVFDYANFHCGCASLVKAEYFGKYIDLFYNIDVINCNADDVFYTYCAAMNGYYYENVGKVYFENMETICSIDPLSNDDWQIDIHKMRNLMKSNIYEYCFIDFSNIKKPKIKINRNDFYNDLFKD